MVEQNVIENNVRYGIYLLIKSDNNVISGNLISNNGGGVRIIASDDNKLFRNRIIDNSVVSNGNNQWDNGVDRGNYYSFFDEESEGFVDGNNDGISDVPYLVPVRKDVDNYPLRDTKMAMSTSDAQETQQNDPVIVSLGAPEKPPEEIPEFPTVAFPILLLMGIFVILNRNGGRDKNL